MDPKKDLSKVHGALDHLMKELQDYLSEVNKISFSVFDFGKLGKLHKQLKDIRKRYLDHEILKHPLFRDYRGQIAGFMKENQQCSREMYAALKKILEGYEAEYGEAEVDPKTKKKRSDFKLVNKFYEENKPKFHAAHGDFMKAQAKLFSNVTDKIYKFGEWMAYVKELEKHPEKLESNKEKKREEKKKDKVAEKKAGKKQDSKKENKCSNEESSDDEPKSQAPVTWKQIFQGILAVIVMTAIIVLLLTFKKAP